MLFMLLAFTLNLSLLVFKTLKNIDKMNEINLKITETRRKREKILYANTTAIPFFYKIDEDYLRSLVDCGQSDIDWHLVIENPQHCPYNIIQILKTTNRFSAKREKLLNIERQRLILCNRILDVIRKRDIKFQKADIYSVNYENIFPTLMQNSKELNPIRVEFFLLAEIENLLSREMFNNKG